MANFDPCNDTYEMTDSLHEGLNANLDLLGTSNFVKIVDRFASLCTSEMKV